MQSGKVKVSAAWQMGATRIVCLYLTGVIQEQNVPELYSQIFQRQAPLSFVTFMDDHSLWLGG